MNITNNSGDIVLDLKKLSPDIIGVDGIDGVGKTSFARNIRKLGYEIISIDNYLKKKSGGYFHFLDFNKLKNDITKIRNESFVLEGILLRKILKKVNLKPNYYIYVTDGVWIYDWLEENQGRYYGLNLKEIIKISESETNLVNKRLNPAFKTYKMKGLRKEIYSYSYRYQPWNDSNFILEIL
ncbi:hypothetical protein A2Z22_01005 [Candidatus Woesebacteria bacterium RBG_16_34_12]|uniref:Uncharacterized protein n=1 Tax=Candidatus Woesebacteria bacterium RBG_16_34_12 TaxID=1802480 RepID=A0A1F7X7X4_9BACT|nr:MAG: hypothetical protein A2Z22_01005 [Candidatus Woesebacteria bacterium RBG_16_34_12]